MNVVNAVNSVIQETLVVSGDNAETTENPGSTEISAKNSEPADPVIDNIANSSSTTESRTITNDTSNTESAGENPPRTVDGSAAVVSNDSIIDMNNGSATKSENIINNSVVNSDNNVVNDPAHNM